MHTGRFIAAMRRAATGEEEEISEDDDEPVAEAALSAERIAALGQRIAQAAEGGWGEVAVAALPNDTALLALARQMCQDPGPKGR